VSNYTREKVKLWAACAGVRALRTAAQVGLLMLGGDTISVVQVDWPAILGFMAGGFVLSMLTSVAGIPEVDDGNALPAMMEED
jgi:hypothetical protein